MNDELLFNLRDEEFSFEAYGVTLKVKRLNLPGHVAFRIEFSSSRKPITIVRASNREGEKFWTTIPENPGRQREAEGVGKLLGEYISKLEN